MLDAIKKESFKGDALNTVRRAVCAFAHDLLNHHRPDVVFIDIRDNGQAANLAVSEDLLRQLSDIRDKRLLNDKIPPVYRCFLC